MAGGSLYSDDADDAAITDINVTPFVDVVLVLLVVFIVTAKLIVARGVVVDKPKGPGGDVPTKIRISVTANGDLYVNGDKYMTDDAAVERIKHDLGTSEPKAVIAGDRKAAYGGVMHAILVVETAGITAIALENEAP
jgi:biopolymer transport protein ExbD